MDLRVIFLTVLLWDFLACVGAKFYLEKINEQILGQGLLKMDLYECSFKDNSKGPFACVKIDNPQLKKKVYESANFWSVLELQLLTGHSLEIDGRAVNEFLPQAWTVGIEPKAYQNPSFKHVNPENELYEYKVAQLKPHFVDTANKMAEQQLAQFLAVNNIAWFLTPTSPSPFPYFANYVVTLRKVIDASGYEGMNLWHLVFGRKGTGRNQIRRSETNTQSFKREDVMAVIHILALKMFDPCFVFWDLDKANAQSFCSVYCLFTSVAFEFYPVAGAGACTDLNAGLCVDKMCKCVRCGYSAPSKSIKMLTCNNALRQTWINN